jgi:hypothetical protein
MKSRDAWRYLFAAAIVVLGVKGLKAQEKGSQPVPEANRKLSKADVEQMMTSLSNWGRWGADDQRGALNLIGPEKRKQAAALLKDGIAISLARPAS